VGYLRGYEIGQKADSLDQNILRTFAYFNYGSDDSSDESLFRVSLVLDLNAITYRGLFPELATHIMSYMGNPTLKRCIPGQWLFRCSLRVWGRCV
jgi:hypothetical protein